MKSRFEDSQRVLWNMNEACFFLTLLSIAEEERCRQGWTEPFIDILSAARDCMKKGYIGQDYFVNNDCAVLEYLTCTKCTKEVVQDCGIVHDNQYTLEKWINMEGSMHFKRRYFDVYSNSQTVKHGVLMCYYKYTFEE